jgi:hypothetical protein
MWQKVATEMDIPWRSAESMHWQLGEQEMSARANLPSSTEFTNEPRSESHPLASAPLSQLPPGCISTHQSSLKRSKASEQGEPFAKKKREDEGGGWSHFERDERGQGSVSPDTLSQPSKTVSVNEDVNSGSDFRNWDGTRRTYLAKITSLQGKLISLRVEQFLIAYTGKEGSRA